VNLPAASILRDKLHNYLVSDPDFRAIYDYTKSRFHDSDLSAHNFEHAYRDVLNAIVIGEAEGADMTVVLPAMTMHDIGFLYGASGATHAKMGADKLAEFLADGEIHLPEARLEHLASCIRTHKGNIHGEVPQSLEAKVVSDADVLDKLGPVGIYQVTRTFAEFNEPHTIAIGALGRTDRRLCTETGNQLADPLRQFNQDFVAALRQAYAPYEEEQE
jgi:uncharacterized protein